MTAFRSGPSDSHSILLGGRIRIVTRRCFLKRVTRQDEPDPQPEAWTGLMTACSVVDYATARRLVSELSSEELCVVSPFFTQAVGIRRASSTLKATPSVKRYPLLFLVLC